MVLIYNAIETELIIIVFTHIEEYKECTIP